MASSEVRIPGKMCKCVCAAHKKLRPAVVVLAVLFMVNLGHCIEVDSNDIEKYLHSKRGERTDNVGRLKEGESAVSLMWGIADATAPIGRFFNYSIPGDAFNGRNLLYKVTAAGKNTLPGWLVFSTNKQLLQGIPSTTDKGQYDLEVVAQGENNQKAKDVFSISVVEDADISFHGNHGNTLKFQKHGPQVVRCKREEPETSVTVVVDTDFDKLNAVQRLDLHGRFRSHLKLPENMLKIVPVGEKSVYDSSALVSGTGDVKSLQSPGTFVSWRVGCGKVEPDHMQVLEQVEEDSSNGVMANEIGHPIHSWHVTNSRFKETKKRKRRAIRATPTPAMTPTPPVRGPSDTIIATKAEVDAMTRPVPSLDSSVLSIQPSHVQPAMTKTVDPDVLPEIVSSKQVTAEIEPSAAVPEPGQVDKTDMLPTRTYTMTDAVMPTKTMPHKPTETTTEATGLPEPEPEPGTRRPIDSECKDLVPSLKHPIKKLELTAGEVFRFKIPENTFSDCRIGSTRKMRLSLFRNKTDSLPKGFWLEFDSRKQVITGLPDTNDVGTHQFTFVAVNPVTVDQPGIDTFIVVVASDPNAVGGGVNHELSLTIDYDYDKFTSNVGDRVSFMNKVGKLYGDRNAKKLTLTRVGRGSTVVAWTNNTLASPTECPVEAIKNMVNRLMNEDGSIKMSAMRSMKPFKLMQAAAVPKGECEKNADFPKRSSEPTDTDTETDKDISTNTSSSPEPEPESTTERIAEGSVTSDDDIWITTVVPAVVIVAILLLALLIACILYRKKRKGKMNLEDQNTFVNKGVPVIFQDELEEKPSDSSKPLLMKGQPPCPPPEYQRGGSEGSTPPVNHKESTPGLEDQEPDLDETDITSPLYQPPPPVTSSAGNKQPRPHVQPTYRSQPPSIPP